MPAEQMHHEFQKQIADSLAASTEPYEILPFTPGLGRTPITVAAIAKRFENKLDARVLIVTRAVLADHWLDVFHSQPAPLVANRRAADPGKEQVTVTTLETLVNRPAYLDIKWDLVIFDYLPQTHKLQRSVSLFTLTRNTDAFWQLISPVELTKGIIDRLTKTGQMLRKLKPTLQAAYAPQTTAP